MTTLFDLKRTLLTAIICLLVDGPNAVSVYAQSKVSTLESLDKSISKLALNSKEGGGSGGGNGGNPTCQASYELGVKYALELLEMDHKLIQARVPQISNVHDLYNIASKRKVLPGDPQLMQGRVVRSDDVSQTSYLDVVRYKEMSPTEKLKIELHELMVLSKIETDGEYASSARLAELFNAKDRLFKLSKVYRCDNYACKVFTPNSGRLNFPGISSYSDLDGICKHLGLGSYINHEETIMKFYAGIPGQLGIVVIDSHGTIVKLLSVTRTEESGIKNIECKKFALGN